MHPSSVPVSREHRRAKTDRLDAELLKRAFLGWLRGEPKHCSMAAIPSIEDEDARRPSRERQSLVKECTRIVNRVKAGLARLGIRGFRLALAQASKQLQTLRTPEGAAVPANTLAESRTWSAAHRQIGGPGAFEWSYIQSATGTQGVDNGRHWFLLCLKRRFIW
jgi:transposase